MTPDENWERICEALEKSQWALLLELGTLHAKQVPDHLEARIIHAIALGKLLRVEEAKVLLRETHDHPNASATCKYHCQCELGHLCDQIGDFDDARTAYEAAHLLSPEKTQPLIYRGVVELRTGNFTQARDWLTRALGRADGDFDEAHFNIGNAYLAEQNYPKAIEHYQNAIKIDPDYDGAWELLADAKRALEIRGISNT